MTLHVAICIIFSHVNLYENILCLVVVFSCALCPVFRKSGIFHAASKVFLLPANPSLAREGVNALGLLTAMDDNNGLTATHLFAKWAV